MLTSEDVEIGVHELIGLVVPERNQHVFRVLAEDCVCGLQHVLDESHQSLGLGHVEVLL